jgi:hypothetical protein
MKIVINTHVKGSIALNHLLESMRKQKEFNNYEVLIVIGGYYHHDTYKCRKESNITYIECNHNSMDLTALITLFDMYKDNVNEHYFYLHDTCKVGDTFYEKLKSIDLTGVSSIKINRQFSMNIGIYSQGIINTFGELLVSLKNFTNDGLVSLKKTQYVEDYIFNNDPKNQILHNYNAHNFTGPTNYYNTGTMRIVEYYPTLDLYKIKANWGQANHDVLTN